MRIYMIKGIEAAVNVNFPFLRCNVIVSMVSAGLLNK